MREARVRKLTGVRLKEDAPPLLELERTPQAP